MRQLVIGNSYGEKLVGILHETGSNEVAVVCHGFRSSMKHNTIVNLAHAISQQGISAFRFDFSGNGQSEGVFQFGNYHREVDDLYAVTQHFHRDKRVVIAIIGHSKGGNVVLLYASKHNDVNMVINISGRFHLEKGIEDRFGKDFLQRIKLNGFIDVNDENGKLKYRVTEEHLMDRLQTNMNLACTSIHEECKVLTIHGSMDEIVPVGDAYEFARCIPDHMLNIIEEADHAYTNHQDELASHVINFLMEDASSQMS